MLVQAPLTAGATDKIGMWTVEFDENMVSMLNFVEILQNRLPLFLENTHQSIKG